MPVKDEEGGKSGIGTGCSSEDFVFSLSASFQQSYVLTYTDRVLSPLNLLLRTYMGRSALAWEFTQRRWVCLPTFRYILPVPSWMVKSSWTTWPVKMGLLGCSITFVANYQSTLRNIPEERRPHLQGGRSLKSVNVTRGFSVERRAARSWSRPPVTM